MQRFSRVLLCFLTLIAATRAADKPISVTVLAGDFERQQTVISFTLPENARGLNRVRDAHGKSQPIQVEKDGRASFVVSQLNKGTHATYELASSSDAPESAVVTRRENNKVKMSV